MSDLGFWAAVGAMAAGVAALLVASLRAARGRVAPAEGATDLQVYRDQMKEVERDLARGTIPPAEGERLRTEIARRLLEADRKLRAAGAAAGGAGSVLVPAALVVLAAAGAVAIYLRMGAPGYPDMPLADRLAAADAQIAARPSQAEMVAQLPPLPAVTAEPDFLALMEKLRAAVDPASSTDLRGLDLLARNEAALNNLAAAEAAQRRLIAVRAGGASADDHAALADILIRAAQGYVSPEAEAELVAALRLDPQNGLALYYSGLLFAQGGRFDRAFALWRPLLEKGPQDAPWVPILRQEIVEVAALAGVNYDLPALRGPSAEDVAAAAELTADDRQAMVEGMVAQLSDRLATEGGTAAEWAQLIRALGILGRTDHAREIVAEARGIFAGREADLAQIEAAATEAGIPDAGAAE